MSCDLTSGRLINDCATGRAGIKVLYITKLNDFSALTGITEAGGEITSLGADPLTVFKFEMADNVGSVEQAVNSVQENGVSFVEQTISLTLYNILPADMENINNLKRGRWTIFAQDYDNKIRLYGRANGFIASGGSDLSGTAPGDKKAYELVLTALENEYAVFLADYTTTPFDNFANVDVKVFYYSVEWDEDFVAANQPLPWGAWTLVGTPTTAEILSNNLHLLSNASSQGARRPFNNVTGRRYKITVTVTSAPLSAYKFDSFGLTFDGTGTRASLPFTTTTVIWATGNRTQVDNLAFYSNTPVSEINIDNVLVEYI